MAPKMSSQLPSGNRKPLVKRAAKTQLLQTMVGLQVCLREMQAQLVLAPSASVVYKQQDWHTRKHDLYTCMTSLDIYIKKISSSNLKMFQQFLQQCLLAVNKRNRRSRSLASLLPLSEGVAQVWISRASAAWDRANFPTALSFQINA